MDPVTATALTIGTTVATASLSAAQASATNRALRSSAASTQRAAGVQARQVADAGVLERTKRLAEARRLRGLVRASQAASGYGAGGTFEALEREADFVAATESNIIGRNVANRTDAIQSGLDADITALRGRRMNPILQSFAGAIEGVGTGLNIAGGLTNIYGTRE